MQFSKLAKYFGLGIVVLTVFAVFVFLYLAAAPAIAAFLDPLLSLIAILTGAVFFLVLVPLALYESKRPLAIGLIKASRFAFLLHIWAFATVYYDKLSNPFLLILSFCTLKFPNFFCGLFLIVKVARQDWENLAYYLGYFAFVSALLPFAGWLENKPAR